MLQPDMKEFDRLNLEVGKTDHHVRELEKTQERVERLLVAAKKQQREAQDALNAFVEKEASRDRSGKVS